MKNTFKFRVADWKLDDIEYVASVEGGEVVVYWRVDGEAVSCEYPKETVEALLHNEDWIVQE